MSIIKMKKIIRICAELPTVLKNRVYFTIHGVKSKHLCAKGRIRIINRGSIELGDNAVINGHDKYDPIGFSGCSNLVTEKNGKIKIGNNFGMSVCTLYSRIGITIGNNVVLGGGVKIYDTDFHSLDFRYRNTSVDKTYAINKPVVIGDDVFIGAGAIILKGVTVGDRAVIGAGAVVAKDICADEIWAGNPAKLVKHRGCENNG